MRKLPLNVLLRVSGRPQTGPGTVSEPEKWSRSTTVARAGATPSASTAAIPSTGTFHETNIADLPAVRDSEPIRTAADKATAGSGRTERAYGRDDLRHVWRRSDKR